MKSSRQFIVRSSVNPRMVYCTDRDWHLDDTIGPGHDLGAKVYKTVGGIKRAHLGSVRVQEVGVPGTELLVISTPEGR